MAGIGSASQAGGSGSGSSTITNLVGITAQGQTTMSLSLPVVLASDQSALAVTNAGLTALNGAISGTEVQVDIVGSLPAGTNNIGDVDVLSVVPGTGATNLGKAIDSAGGATDTGVASLAIRDDALTAITPIEGDYAPLRVGQYGDLWVSLATKLDSTNDSITVVNAGLTELAAAINASSQMDVNIAASAATLTVASHAVTNAGTFAVQVDGAALTSLQLLDDTVATDGSATPTKGILMAGQDGTNAQTIKTDTSGELQVDVLTMPIVAVTQSGTWDEVGINDSGNSITVDNATISVVGGGVEATAQRVTIASDSTGVLSVDDNGGALTVDGTVTANLAAGTNNIGDVDVLSVIPGTGATNLGKAIDTATGGTDTGVLALATRDDALGALTPIEGDNVQLRTDANGALWTHDDALDAALGGSELQVDIVGALPAGTAAIGKLAANSGVDIGDVDVTTVGTITPGTAATSLGKAEDGAHTSGDVGVFTLGVRNDTPNAALAGTDLDYSPVAVYKTGALRIAPPEEDFAVLGSNSVKKYYTNAGAVTDGIVWSPAAGKRWYVTDIFITVSAAATVTLEDDLGAGDSAVWKAELAANSGWSHSFSTPLFSGEDAADLLVTTSAGNVYITVTGYEI